MYVRELVVSYVSIRYSMIAPDSHACVWVFDYRDTAVGVELFEGRLFEIAIPGRVLGLV